MSREVTPDFAGSAAVAEMGLPTVHPGGEPHRDLTWGVRPLLKPVWNSPPSAELLRPVSPFQMGRTGPHTRHQRSPDEASHCPVQVGVSMQCVAYRWRSPGWGIGTGPRVDTPCSRPNPQSSGLGRPPHPQVARNGVTSIPTL